MMLTDEQIGAAGYVSAMGEAAQSYLDSFPFSHKLPAQFRWADLWEVMRKAAPWPTLSDLHLQALMFAYNEGYSKAIDGRKFKNPFSSEGSQAAAWELGTADGAEARSKMASAPVADMGNPMSSAPVAWHQPYPALPKPDVTAYGEAEDSYSRSAMESAMRAAHDRGYSVGWDHGKERAGAPVADERAAFTVELSSEQEEQFSKWVGVEKMTPWQRSVARLAKLLNTTNRGLIDYGAAQHFANELVSRAALASAPVADEREPLPCPFCGGRAFATYKTDEDDIRWHSVHCRTECRGYGKHGSEKDAIAAWNTRTTLLRKYPNDEEIIDLAVEPLGIDCDRMPHGVVVFARNLLSRYAAPQASEAATTEEFLRAEAQGEKRHG